MGDVDSLSRFEFMISESAEDILVSIDKYPEIGRGHDRVGRLKPGFLYLLAVVQSLLVTLVHGDPWS